jgi:hypothetical protein
MRFRNPEGAIVNAVQYHSDLPDPDGFHAWPDEHGCTPRDMSFGYCKTPIGRIHVQHGDWIVTNPDGSQQVCGAEHFEKYYKLAPATSSTGLDNKNQLAESVTFAESSCGIPREDLADIARVGYEANRAYAIRLNENLPHWEEAADTERVIWFEAARVHATMPEESLEVLHSHWCYLERQAGWSYGPKLDNAKKQHPHLVTWIKLPEPQRVKVALFRAIVRSLIGWSESQV